MSTKLESFAAMAGQVERQSALGLMGQDIVVQASQFETDGSPRTLGYRLETQADKVNLYILDRSGNPVVTIPTSNTAPGEYFLQWDGTDNSGMPVEPGRYEVVVRALDENEDVLQSQSLIRTTVSGVDLDSDAARLVTAAGIFDMSKVSRVGSAISDSVALAPSVPENSANSTSTTQTSTAFL
jgi:flagellar basal-body rod modification protein FlgD